ncbi:hypothetical protein [Nocardia blacklockiae]|uniref:hypothetical protein n=1 Tax=Nocardia blacklockiae TaxID=480036 RepID=UPI001895D2BA|nr:hypothetical protein [Nocardia blacklockiae]MBF6171562.1 hypothetical protein [Nocardia blacklockiae]
MVKSTRILFCTAAAAALFAAPATLLSDIDDAPADSPRICDMNPPPIVTPPQCV